MGEYAPGPAWNDLELVEDGSMNPTMMSTTRNASDEIIVATAVKQTKKDNHGLKFVKKLPVSPVTIQSIQPNGLFANSGLKVGLQVVSINDIPIIKGKTPPFQAFKILQNAVGEVKIVAKQPDDAEQCAEKTVEITVVRETKYDKLGFTMGKRSPEAPVTIKSIDPYGLFANTELQVGMMIIRINHVHFRDGKMPDNKLALMEVINTLGKVTVKARNPTRKDFYTGDCDINEAIQKMAAVNKEEAAFVLKDTVVVTVHRKTKKDNLGFTLGKAEDVGGTTTPVTPVTVKSIEPGSLFANTDLQVGMMIIRINHLYFHGGQMPKKIDLISVLNELGKVTVEARYPVAKDFEKQPNTDMLVMEAMWEYVSTVELDEFGGD
mmetsp:Transcript_14283/g.34672  ORF Transcript_14283/g.34672 Transcript_14283/m.34672 type:complete len:378 (+) Transcript_14283:51-1184(+)